MAGGEGTEKANHRLPAKDIRWILAQVPEVPPARFEALKRSNPELVPRPGEEEEDEMLVALYGVTRTFYEVKERLPKLQEWVRGELRSKGYVEVDDDWFKCVAESQAENDREWPGIRAKMDELSMMDGPCNNVEEAGDDDDSESDSDEEEEDEDAALASVMKDYL